MALQTIGIQTSLWNKTTGVAILLSFVPVSFCICFMYFAADYSAYSAMKLFFFCIITYCIAFWILYQLQDIIIRETLRSLPIAPDEHPELFKFIDYCCAVLKNVERPRVELLNTRNINALSYGVDRYSYAIVVTEELLNQPKPVWQAMVANEMSQIYSGTTRFLSMTHFYLYGAFPAFIVFGGIFGKLSEIGFIDNPDNFLRVFMVSGICLIPFIWILTSLIQRRLEYMTDANTIILTKDAEALFQAISIADQMNIMSDIPLYLRSLSFIDNTPGRIFHPSRQARLSHLRKIYNVLDFTYTDKVRQEFSL